MAGLPYTHPDDDWSPSGWTLESGTAASGYPIENLGNEDPSLPFKLTTDTFRIVLDMGAPNAIRVLAIIHHNFNFGLAGVSFDMNDSNSWGSPAFSHAIDIPAWQEDGFPTNILVDLSDTAPTYRYASLVVSSANAEACAIGEIVMVEAWRELPVDFQVGGSAIDDEDHPGIRNDTDAGVSTVYPYGNRRRWLRGDILDTNQDDDELIRRWNRAAKGNARPFLVNPELPIVEPWYVKFETSRLPRKRLFRDVDNGSVVYGYSLGFEEVSRGLIPEPSAV